MIQTGFESRVKIQQIIESQIPEFLFDESPKVSEFLKQYYISQEYQSGPIDIAENLDQYLKVDNLTPEVIVGSTTLSSDIDTDDTTIVVTSTKGFPKSYGLLKIDDEIITYTGITTASFTGCIRGFSGITNYHSELDPGELVFSKSTSAEHVSDTRVENLSSLFLQEFYKKIKYTITPGLESVDFVSDLNVGNFIKESRSLYETKGTPESFRILFNVLYGENASVIDLEKFLSKSSDAEYLRRKVAVIDLISGNPTLLSGQTIYKNNDTSTSAAVSEVETIFRKGKIYYKLLLFVGYDDTFSSITGSFNITGSSKVTQNATIEPLGIGETVISVDSTIGFPESGKIYCGDNEIIYSDKTVNQFLGCYVGIATTTISKTDIVRSDEIYYGYENGDETKKVEFRITGVISDVVLDDDDFNFLVNDEFYPLNVGEKIQNLSSNKKEIFANSWFYNTSTRDQIDSYSGIGITVKSDIDKSSLKIGDTIEILERNNETVAISSATVVNVGNKTIEINTNTNVLNPLKDYDIRRKLNTASSSVSSIEFGNNIIMSDVLNVYDENSEYMYVASNSLPSYDIGIQTNRLISPQKVLKKFKLDNNLDDNIVYETLPGTTGMLKNGVEIYNYKTNDKVYYGPIDNVRVLNGGRNFDVINPPYIEPSFGDAVLQPVVTGSVERVYVEPQDFDLNSVISISLSGGNGKGCQLKPIIKKYRREIEFNARDISLGGGLSYTDEYILFSQKHNLVNGQPIVYDSNGNVEIGIGTYNGSNNNQSKSLKNNAIYYSEVVNDSAIRLYQSFSDYISGINTVGFTTIGNAGIHKFKTEVKNNLSEIEVVNGGEGYTNRKLRVSPSAVSTSENAINYIDHGFSDGELVNYSYETSVISGLSTSNQYYVLKVDEDSFRLCNAGVGGTISVNYERKNYVKFNNSGTGYQTFKYPDISLSINYSVVGLGSTQVRGTLNATPIVRGKISQVYVYDGGVGYGVSSINVHQRPKIEVKIGKNAQLIPIIINGSISKVIVLNGGSEYYSTPDLIVNGSGSGAILQPIIVNNKISRVVVINSGIGYLETDTTIFVKSAGEKSVFQSNIKSWIVNSSYLYGSSGSYDIFDRIFASEALVPSKKNLQYVISGYSQKIKDYLGDDGQQNQTHSPIIGWAYDGNPIYGPFGYSNPSDSESFVKLLESGYSPSRTNGLDLVSFPLGFFVEDFSYVGNGDLDECNGRYCVTPEFPNGTYAYFASIQITDGQIYGKFPYFIGNKYRSSILEENKELDHSFDFNNSPLIRNTFPYKVNERYANYDFITESNEIINQKTLIESVSKGNISKVNILESGYDYSVGDEILFDNTNTGGQGLSVKVSEIKGKEIIDIQTSVSSYTNSLITWESNDLVKVYVSPYHNFIDGDNINITGLSTQISKINGSYKIGVTTYNSSLEKEIPAYALTGIVTDIYVSSIPSDVSAGSSIKIENELFSILNSYPENGILKVYRSSSGVAHTQSSPIEFLPNSFTVNKKIDYFESKNNYKTYFNPTQSVGVGTTSGVGVERTFKIGDSSQTVFIPTQSIYLPNHKFSTNQQVILRKPEGASSISVANTSTSNSFNILDGNFETLYVIKKSKDLIGIVTSVGFTTTTNGLFLLSSGSNNYRYSIETSLNQITADVSRVESVVSVSTAHNLNENDNIILRVKPDLSVGVGSSSFVYVKRESNTNTLLTNPISFTPSQINTETNLINITSHNLKTGDKVYYNSTGIVATGLSAGFYYVYVIDKNNISLCETYLDPISSPPLTVDITGTGTFIHSLSSVNPRISIIRNNNLVFNLTDSSLVGYKLKIFYDKNFTKEFNSIGNSNEFSIYTTGTPGVDGYLVINYSDNFPESLYYALEYSGQVLSPDKDVNNYSEILLGDSVYNGSYTITSVGTSKTTFTVSLKNIPERLSYIQSQCDLLEYSTKKVGETGGVYKVEIESSGFGYESLPKFVGTDSETGYGFVALPLSNTIGKIKELRIVNEGFEYASDKTLRPTTSIPKIISIVSSNTIDSISILDGGKNYDFPPNLVVINSDTGELIESSIIKAVLSGSSIQSTIIESNPKGLPDNPVTIRAVNNSNGYSIQKVEISGSEVTCTLVTPLSGFNTPQFSIGDKIFVENIQKQTSAGDGFNSSDYGYDFFVVKNYLNLNPAKVIFDLPSNNPGTPIEVQNGYATIVRYSDYPKFKVNQIFSPFFVGEKISLYDGSNLIETDLIVTNSNENFVRVNGTYDLSAGEIIQGLSSYNLATVSSQESTSGKYNIDHFALQNYGWKNEIGKLSDDTQFISDNDYYQNLSYSVKSSKTWEEIVTPVNNLLHSSGLKNFADTQLLRNASFGVGIGTTSTITLLNNYIRSVRIDTIYNFALARDVDVLDDKSKFLEFLKLRLSDYIVNLTNRVLPIDDISSEFDNQTIEFETFYKGIPIFSKVFDPSDNTIIDSVGAENTGTINIDNHFFVTGEELTYSPGNGGTSMGIGATSDYLGIVTTILPNRLWAIKTDVNSFKVSTRPEYASQGIAVSFTSVGVGTEHQIEMYNKNEKSLIAVNNMVQYPIAYTSLLYTLSGNGGQIGIGTTVFALSGITSIIPNDLLKIENEYVVVENVGFGTTSIGPITFTGSVPLVEVTRGALGSVAVAHTDTTESRVYRGSYNIVGNKIFFTESPYGETEETSGFSTSSNLPLQKSQFHGRVFLRNNYSTNLIYDDVSDQFNGIGQTFTLKNKGNDVTGIGTDGSNGIVFINGVFQAPTTQNNSGNNFSIQEDTISGISSIVFTGVKLGNGDQYTSITDVNLNQIPRGGIIISYGSTPGLGYAPLVGASATAIVSGGTIIGIGISNIGSGYRSPVPITVTESGHTGSVGSITATVGVGGTLSFNLVSGGSGYTNPIISIPSPSYENLPVIGVSRLGVGATTETGSGLLLNVEVGASSTSVGIGSTLFEVKSFNIVRNGYGFKRGDVFKPVGLVTDKGLSSPVSEFEITVLEEFNDSFGSWQFGELDYIDSIKEYQDGVRKRFPLYYNSQLLSFEIDETNEDSALIDFSSLLVIFINGILQQPNEAYTFEGGTSFSFIESPKEEDEIQVFFYRGTSGTDSKNVSVEESLKIGDTIQVFSNNNLIENTTTQEKRIVYDITKTDTLETNLYYEQGIDEVNYKPISWEKQKRDLIIFGDSVSKSRDSLEGQVYPTANIIKDITTLSTEIFVDNSELFDYENDLDNLNAIIINHSAQQASGNVEIIKDITSVQGKVVNIVGIATTTGIGGHPLALEFAVSENPSLSVGYAIYVSGTGVGSGVTSVDSNDSNIVSISTSFVNNVYYVHASSSGIVTCNIASNTSIVGIATTGTSNAPVGKLSWGRLSGFTRSSSPISIGVSGYTSSIGITSEGYSAGLTTYPIIQRRGNGLRYTGALVKNDP
jgi:hypothetical protein